MDAIVTSVGVQAEVEACEETGTDAATEASAKKCTRNSPGRGGSRTRGTSGSRVRHQRFGTKRKPCQKCGEPCREGCCTLNPEEWEDTLPDQKKAKAEAPTAGSAPNAPAHASDSAPSLGGSSGDAADTFMAVARRILDSRRTAQSSSTSEGAQPTLRRSPTAALETADGRKRRKKQALLPSNFGEAPAWLRNRPMVGGAVLHSSHTPHLAWHRGITWCWRCGTFALEVPNKLRAVCEPPSVAGARQLVRLRLGLTPRNSVNWPVDERRPELDRREEALL